MADKDDAKRKEVNIVLQEHEVFYLESITRGDDQWKDYRDNIVVSNGYDPKDPMVQFTFTMPDYTFKSGQFIGDDNAYPLLSPEAKGSKGSKGSKPSKAPKPTKGPKPSKAPKPTKPAPTPKPTKPPPTYRPSKSPITDYPTAPPTHVPGFLKCYSKFMDGNGLLTCNKASEVVVGCTSGWVEDGSWGHSRSGEQALSNSCQGGGGDVWIRCCRPDDPSIILVQKTNKIREANDWCNTGEVSLINDKYPNGDYQLVGCTGWFSNPAASS